MTIAILDPSAGISGDMTIAALLDLGLDPEWIRGLPGRLGFPEVGVTVRKVERCAIAATRVEFSIPGAASGEALFDPGGAHVHHGGHSGGGETADHGHGTHLSELLQRIDSADLSDRVKLLAQNTFRGLAEAEARVHGVEVEGVHLHEVGAVDAIVDVVGAVEGFELLGVAEIYNLPVALGGGWVDAAHGRLPVPAPATVELLGGVEIAGDSPATGEATTPTGAALLKALSSGPPPPGWRLQRSGWGAGTRDPEGYANALRIILAEPVSEGAVVEVVATDLDDMSPEYLEPLREALERAGALDTQIWATQGKKGRIGFRVEALALPADAERVAEELLTHSTSAGVRRWSTRRRTLDRRFVEVDMGSGARVRVKVYRSPAGERLKAEFDDVMAAAGILGQPPHEVARRAELLAQQEMNEPTFAV